MNSGRLTMTAQASANAKTSRILRRGQAQDAQPEISRRRGEMDHAVSIFSEPPDATEAGNTLLAESGSN